MLHPQISSKGLVHVLQDCYLLSVQGVLFTYSLHHWLRLLARLVLCFGGFSDAFVSNGRYCLLLQVGS
jgi:hypothetical protein